RRRVPPRRLQDAHGSRRGARQPARVPRRRHPRSARRQARQEGGEVKIWRVVRALVRLAFASSFFLPAIYFVRPDAPRGETFLVALSIACGIYEAAKLAAEVPR